MTRPVESVVAEALQRLESTGRLDVEAYLMAYPEHADELRELLPTMLTLRQEQRWERAEAQARQFAVDLFDQLAPRAETLGSLLTRERTEGGLTLAEQARRSGLPSEALERLSSDATPLSALDNLTVKSLAARVSAPFASLLKEVRRLISLSQLGEGQAVFTRDRELTSAEEQEELIKKVKDSARKPPEER